MLLQIPRFCPILDRSLRPDLSPIEVAAILATVGVRLVQLRSKRTTSQDLLCDARQLVSSLPSICALTVNDRADVTALAGAAGVHLGQDDLPVTAARGLLGPDKLIGLSTHNEEQIEAAHAVPVDYLAIGPVFATTTKSNPEPVLGLGGLRDLRRRTDKPVMAIGGITPANAAAAIEAGADSVAVISAWLVTDAISARLEEFRRALGELG